jgi:hypothetical protein
MSTLLVEQLPQPRDLRLHGPVRRRLVTVSTQHGVHLADQFGRLIPAVHDKTVPTQASSDRSWSRPSSVGPRMSATRHRQPGRERPLLAAGALRLGGTSALGALVSWPPCIFRS